MKRFVATVYFRGPISRWARAVDMRDVLWREDFRFRSVAAGVARARARPFEHVGWLVQDVHGRVIAGALPSPDVQ